MVMQSLPEKEKTNGEIFLEPSSKQNCRGEVSSETSESCAQNASVEAQSAGFERVYLDDDDDFHTSGTGSGGVRKAFLGPPGALLAPRESGRPIWSQFCLEGEGGVEVDPKFLRRGHLSRFSL